MHKPLPPPLHTGVLAKCMGCRHPTRAKTARPPKQSSRHHPPKSVILPSSRLVQSLLHHHAHYTLITLIFLHYFRQCPILRRQLFHLSHSPAQMEKKPSGNFLAREVCTTRTASDAKPPLACMANERGPEYGTRGGGDMGGGDTGITLP